MQGVVEQLVGGRGDEAMKTETQRCIDFNVGDQIHIERGTHAGWAIRSGYADQRIMGETAFFSNSTDVLKYLGAVFGNPVVVVE